MNSRISIALLLAWAGMSCSDEEASPQVDCSADPVTLQVQSVTDSECGANDGQVEVAASGGSGTYQYRLGNGGTQSSPVFDSLAAGVYEVTAVDENNCAGTVEVTVRNSEGVNMTATSSDAGGCDGKSGAITINATDGTPPYEFRLENQSFGSSSSFENLAAGTYEVSARDASGCEVTQTVRVRSGISFSSSIQPIIQNKCAINTCHNGNQFPDFRNFANVQGNAAKIKELTGNRTMPQEGSLTQAEIDMIACWVDDGAPNN